MNVLKKCKCCNQYKPLNDFGKNKTSKDGFRNTCKNPCLKAKNSLYYEKIRGAVWRDRGYHIPLLEYDNPQGRRIKIV